MKTAQISTDQVFSAFGGLRRWNSKFQNCFVNITIHDDTSISFRMMKPTWLIILVVIMLLVPVIFKGISA